MEFAFDVGTTEKHRVQLQYNQFLGIMHISVDGEIAVKDWRLYDTQLTQVFRLSVGRTETHDVRIEKTRKLFSGGTRKQTYKVFIDGQLVEEH